MNSSPPPSPLDLCLIHAMFFLSRVNGTEAPISQSLVSNDVIKPTTV